MRFRFQQTRRGAALIWVVVVLAVLGVTSAVAVREFVTARQMLAMRQNRLQAEWLARSGAEIAVARLLADDKYAGETIELIPTGPVRVTVEKDAAKPNTYRIGCAATYPTGDYRAVHFALTRTATRKADGGKVTVKLAGVVAANVDP